MCELLAMSCRYPARLTSSLSALAARAAGNSRNHDGWGLAFYQGHDFATGTLLTGVLKRLTS